MTEDLKTSVDRYTIPGWTRCMIAPRGPEQNAYNVRVRDSDVEHDFQMEPDSIIMEDQIEEWKRRDAKEKNK